MNLYVTNPQFNNIHAVAHLHPGVHPCLASLFNFCLCLPSGEWGPIKGEKGGILDIRLHRVYGIITEGDAERACVGNWG